MFDELKNFPFELHKNKESIDCYDYELGKCLDVFGKCNVKYIPDSIKKMSPEKIRIFLDAYAIADGIRVKAKNFGKNDSASYFTTSENLANDIAELIAKTGKRPSILIQKVKGKKCFDVYKHNFDVYVITECNNSFTAVERLKKEEIEYNDFVYCVELEKNNTLYVQYEGKFCWSGNCRSTTVPAISNKYVSEFTRIARDSDGKNYKVPANMTYNQWQEDKIKNPQINLDRPVEDVVIVKGKGL